MPGKKAVFFDIDGTLWDFTNRIPESTKEAIRKLREGGHLAFLCSGRGRAYIQNRKLLDIGFDGIISGCGAMIEYHGETIFYKKLEVGLVERTIHTVRSFGFRPILEGPNYLYMDDVEFGEDPYGRKIKSEIGDHVRTIAGEWGRWEISKLSCATEDADQEACLAALESDYDFIIHNAAVVEIVPKGFHKGTGIRKLCELLDIDPADTFAFGDSANDLGMFQAVGTSVAMGSGSQAARDAADYVTAPLWEDGIWKACRHFSLI